MYGLRHIRVDMSHYVRFLCIFLLLEWTELELLTCNVWLIVFFVFLSLEWIKLELLTCNVWLIVFLLFFHYNSVK